MSWIACTRMYDVTPDVRQHWHALMLAAGTNAGVPIECIDHAAPASLTDLWSRDDLALAFAPKTPMDRAAGRDRTLADAPDLDYTMAAEILFLIETLEKAE